MRIHEAASLQNTSDDRPWEYTKLPVYGTQVMTDHGDTLSCQSMEHK